MLKFAYTILYVKDVERSLTFYEKAFGFKKEMITPGHEYGELRSGSTVLSFATFQQAKTNLPDGFIESSVTGKPFGIELGFTTTDVAKTLDKAIKAGAVVVEKPKIKPWGQTVCYIKDPDGFLIELCTPMED
jgi:lactoylglutathione lyase